MCFEIIIIMVCISLADYNGISSALKHFTINLRIVCRTSFDCDLCYMYTSYRITIFVLLMLVLLRQSTYIFHEVLCLSILSRITCARQNTIQ